MAKKNPAPKKPVVAKTPKVNAPKVNKPANVIDVQARSAAHPLESEQRKLDRLKNDPVLNG